MKNKQYLRSSNIMRVSHLYFNRYYYTLYYVNFVIICKFYLYCYKLYNLVTLTKPRRIIVRQRQIPLRHASNSQNGPGNHTRKQQYHGYISL